ncbi:MAG: tRNA (adenosine(37)-N6)-threonylcarbamoyltransferase complex dimerization subunit type 1 TsaB [Clostridiales bacterium]|nr:tRNA (adenosine(37)-N6)-threonylcarbamoyltransferase complex dimerization subunit type 1 TsaB [Clostridiales bacterium]
MKILAIEAAAKTAGAAVYCDGVIVAEEAVANGLTHSQTLMPMVEEVLRQAGMDGRELDLLTFTKGPGSFTGLRIGAATVKGLSMGWQKPVLPLSTLEVLAYNLAGHKELIVPVMDARRHQVYTAVYECKDDALCSLFGPDVVPAAALIAFLEQLDRPAVLVGDTRTVTEEAGGTAFDIAPAHLNQLRPAAACALAESLIRQGIQPIPGAKVEIEYLRKPQAEREREARLRAEQS